MVFIYNLGIGLFNLVIRLAAPFNNKAKLWVLGRKNLINKIGKEVNTDDPVIWFHAASLGEFEQGRPIIESWKEKYPRSKVLLTFFSPSGYEIRKNYTGADFIYYLPLDTQKNARRFMDAVKPKVTVFIKYEFWYHFLREAKLSGSKLVLVSAIFRPTQIFFKKYGNFYRRILRFFDHIFVQDEYSFQLLSRFEDLKVTISGDSRFDRVAQIAAEARPDEKAEVFSKDRFTFVFGSTWEKDEQLLLQYINQSNSKACFIIAPHEIDQGHLRQISSALNPNSVFYSQANEDKLKKARVLIIDNIGILSSLYKYGRVAYIGGGFGKGIHNILEPAVNGMPVVIGPNYSKFKEAVDLVSEGGAFSIDNFESLKQLFNRFLEDKKILDLSSQATKSFVQRNLGASAVVLNYLSKT